MQSLDLRHLGSPEARAAEAQRFWTRETQGPFDLTCGPLVRVALVQLSEEEHVLIVTMHHIVSDAWSIGVFMRELVAFYNGISTGRDVCPCADDRCSNATSPPGRSSG